MLGALREDKHNPSIINEKLKLSFSNPYFWRASAVFCLSIPPFVFAVFIAGQALFPEQHMVLLAS